MSDFIFDLEARSIEYTGATSASRTMLKLKNKGKTSLSLDNSDSANTWSVSQNGDNLSIKGTGGYISLDSETRLTTTDLVLSNSTSRIKALNTSSETASFFFVNGSNNVIIGDSDNKLNDVSFYVGGSPVLQLRKTGGKLNFIGTDQGTSNLADSNVAASLAIELNGTAYRLALYPAS